VSMLSQWGRAAVGAIGGFLSGGAPGALRGGMAGYQAGSGAGTSMVHATPTPPMTAPGGGWGGTGVSIGGPLGIDIGSWHFGQGGVATPSGAAGCPKGYHLNKHPLAASKRHGAMPARSMCVRNRHMHPLNSRALVRSLRRLKRARKLVSKLHSFGGARASSSRRAGHRAGCRCVTCRR
jgi:hypothetical protein